MSPSGGHRRRRIWAALGLVALALAIVAVVVLTRSPGNVSNPDVEFDAAPPTTSTQPPVKRNAKDPFDDGFAWPVYGLTKSRTRYLPLDRPLQPPFTERWRMTGRILLEFTPVLCGHSLYLLKNNGALYKISRRTGEVRWKKKLGYLAAASPACGHGTIYNVLLERHKGAGAGRVVATDADDGRTKWSRKLPSRSESSPLLDGGRLYFGSEDGTVYALRARDGAIRWTYRSGGAVKAALALYNGMLIFGDYAGQVTAISRADGHRLWRTGTSGGAFGLKSGTFYATPSVAYGRVYLGNTDGFVYSFGAKDGRLAWRHKTGSYVYSSPAVSDAQGGTVFAGSYDGKLYAFNARTGSVRWTHDAGGRISGGPVVIGNLVFYSNLGKRSTVALGVNTGRKVWGVGRGAFNPVISDGKRLYLNGYSSLYMFAERGRTSTGTLTKGERKRRADHRRAVQQRRHRRDVQRRVARRKAHVHRILEMRRKGIKVCFRKGGKQVCRLPRPPVCVKRDDGRTVCRARER